MPLVTLPDKAALLIGASQMGAMLHGGRVVWRGPLPTLTVTDGTITPFTRSGVDYTQVIFRQSGEFTLSARAAVRCSLWSGGASGGSRSSDSTGNGGGGAGWCADASELPAGSYTVTIGAGGVGSTGAGNDGSPSSLSGPVSITVPGGGGGGTAISSGVAPGRPGGNGGGGSGGVSANWPGGAGDPGNDGGIGLSSGTLSERAGGGGGGAGGPGQDASSAVPGLGGPGILLDWVAYPFTAGIGGDGSLGSAGSASPDVTNACGSNGIYGSASGNGGDGFFVMVVRSDDVIVEMVE